MGTVEPPESCVQERRFGLWGVHVRVFPGLTCACVRTRVVLCSWPEGCDGLDTCHGHLPITTPITCGRRIQAEGPELTTVCEGLVVVHVRELSPG